MVRPDFELMSVELYCDTGPFEGNSTNGVVDQDLLAKIFEEYSES